MHRYAQSSSKNHYTLNIDWWHTYGIMTSCIIMYNNYNTPVSLFPWKSVLYVEANRCLLSSASANCATSSQAIISALLGTGVLVVRGPGWLANTVWYPGCNKIVMPIYVQWYL